ncbi:MAG: NAD(P)/FAD-dependent oxidoreductase, partial [Angelakisella sp.]|nr:NAD(P)/FAD-dependent oxidoreductase [Angelakisella sp.]
MKQFDRIIIGGGAAGMFAAGFAGQRGERVLVLEKRERPARKILVTGKGRCNLTNNCTPQQFIAAVRRNPRFLMSAAYAFPPQQTMAVFEGLGVPLKTERGGRVFPVSDRAMDIADALCEFARRGGVQVVQAAVTGLILENGAVCGARTADGREYRAPLTVLATGGKSYPATGSDGSG